MSRNFWPRSLARTAIVTVAAIALAANLLCLPLAYALAQQLNRAEARGGRLPCHFNAHLLSASEVIADCPSAGAD